MKTNVKLTDSDMLFQFQQDYQLNIKIAGGGVL